MATLILEGNTLGEKHKYFNKLVKDAVKSKQINLTKINKDESDINNLLKIDTACKIRNVDFIIEVLKCDDMLYVSRAIKHSTWLITEQQYAHIINPEYLYTELFPHMLTKAFNKLFLHIRLHLKDEKRVEAFYDYFKNRFDNSHKWLPKCSIPFIENVLINERRIPLQTYERLCRRSIKFLPYHTRVEGPREYKILQSVLFLLKSHPEEYLSMVETAECYLQPWHTNKSTEIIMKKCPHRILNDFEGYASNIKLPIVAKYLKKDDIRDFMFQHIIKSQYTIHLLREYKNLNPFIENMPPQQRFEFIKETHLIRGHNYNSAKESRDFIPCSVHSYEWYKYAPFDIAFNELKKMIRAESSPDERCAMLSVLIGFAKENPQYIKIILNHYYDKHRNEPYKSKIKFVNNVITQVNTHEFDKETWNIMDKLFRSLDVYTKSDNNVQVCLQAMFLYKILHDENIPENLEKKMTFNTFKKVQNKLNEEQKNKLFCYLINFLSRNLSLKNINNESSFNDAVTILNNSLNLLKDWKKNITDYVFVLNTLKELIKIGKENSWKIENMSSLYNMNKSWRRFMFEESVALCSNEEVYLNVLKHDPQLLTRHSDEINALRRNNTVSLRRFISKIRVYWSESLAQLWTDIYLNDVNQGAHHKTTIKNLFGLLPQKQLIDFSKKYIPKEIKINWSEINETELKLCKYIAGSFYVARPCPPLEVVLAFAKGDYLQYAVPSLNSLLHNISQVQSYEHIPTLLEAPVSLQKHGLNLAFKKLKVIDLKPILLRVWKTTTNTSIQMALFTHTFNQLCKVKNQVIATELWELLSMFFDKLPLEENGIIFNKLKKIKKVHDSVRGEFFMKCYSYMTSFPTNEQCETHLKRLTVYAPNIMNMLDADFVVEKILAPIDDKATQDLFIEIISSFVLHGKTEDEQCERFRRSLRSALEQALVNKNSLSLLLNSLITNFLKFTFAKKIIVPIKLFEEIKSFMEEKKCTQENYVEYTRWKLVTDYVKLVDENKTMLSDPELDKLSVLQFRNGSMPDEAGNIWEEMHTAICPKMGPIILKHLKHDTEKYFPTITWLFSEALQLLFETLTFPNPEIQMEILTHILDKDFIPSYLLVCQFQGYFEDNNLRFDGPEKRIEIRKLLLAHPSREVQMHYYRALRQRPE